MSLAPNNPHGYKLAGASYPLRIYGFDGAGIYNIHGAIALDTVNGWTAACWTHSGAHFSGKPEFALVDNEPPRVVTHRWVGVEYIDREFDSVSELHEARGFISTRFGVHLRLTYEDGQLTGYNWLRAGEPVCGVLRPRPIGGGS